MGAPWRGVRARLRVSRHDFMPDLTRREREVLALLLRGCTDKEICGRLGIAHGTLRTHVARLYRDLGVTNRATLITKWHRLERIRRGGKAPR